MHRALVGGWLVVILLSGLLASASVFGPAEPGTPVRQAAPVPPAPGTCVVGGLDLTVVPCDVEHAGEIVLSWTGASHSTELDPVRYPPDRYPRGDPSTWCETATVDHFGLDSAFVRTSDEWFPPFSAPPGWTTQVARGPGLPAVEDWSWSACVVEVLDLEGRPTTLDRSLRSIAATPLAQLPRSWLPCGVDAKIWSSRQVPCTEPHRKQSFAGGSFSLTPGHLAELRTRMDEAPESFDPTSSLLLPPEVEVTEPGVVSSCRAVIESALGGPLDIWAAELRPVVGLMSFIYDDNGAMVPSEGAATPVAAWLDCSVHVIADQDLVGSLYDVGSGPLPFG